MIFMISQVSLCCVHEHNYGYVIIIPSISFVSVHNIIYIPPCLCTAQLVVGRAKQINFIIYNLRCLISVRCKFIKIIAKN